MAHVRKFRKVQHTKSKIKNETTKRKDEPIQGGGYIRCDCGAWFIPIFENQPTCLKCRKEAREKDCHSYAPELWGTV